MRSYLLTFVLAVVFGTILTPITMRVASRIGALDRTKGPPIPRVGGVAVAASAALALALLGAVFHPVRGLLLLSVSQLGAVYGGAAVVLSLGLTDDIVRLKALPKFTVEVLVAVGLYVAGMRIDTVWLPFGIVGLGHVVGLAFTVLWVVGITNAFNLLDGIDGVAAGAAVFALLAMFVTSVSLGQPMVAMLAVSLAGATLGFLRYNFAPARVFLGDGGSLFLGFMLATLAIRGATKGPAMVAIAIPVLAFGLPVMDTAFTVARRGLRGVPLFTGDREHLHHRLLDLGLSPRQAALVLYVVSAAFALASMLFVNPNVRGMAVGLTMVGLLVWSAVRYLRLHEFHELGRLARRGLTQTRAIAFNVGVRRAAAELPSCATWTEVAERLARLFAESDFDEVRLVVRAAGDVRTYPLEDGQVLGMPRPEQVDEWSLRLPFDAGLRANVQGELVACRRYGRTALVTDVNLLTETLRPALAAAAARLDRPA